MKIFRKRQTSKKKDMRKANPSLLLPEAFALVREAAKEQ